MRRRSPWRKLKHFFRHRRGANIFIFLFLMLALGLVVGVMYLLSTGAFLR